MCQNRIDLSRYVKEKPFDPTVAGIESKSDIEQKTNSSIVTTYERKILKKKFRRNPTIDRKNKINTPNETDIRSLMNIDIYITFIKIHLPRNMRRLTSPKKNRNKANFPKTWAEKTRKKSPLSKAGLKI